MLIAVSEKRFRKLPVATLRFDDLVNMVDGKEIISNPVRTMFTSPLGGRPSVLIPTPAALVQGFLPDPGWAVFRCGRDGIVKDLACLHAQNF